MSNAPTKNTCQVHYVTNCPLCKAGASVPPPITPEPVDEVQKLISEQKPLIPTSTATNTVTVTTSTEATTISDPHASNVMVAAQTYAVACEQVSEFTAKTNFLEMDLHAAQKDLLAAMKLRDEAQRKLASLVSNSTINSSVDSHTKEQDEE